MWWWVEVSIQDYAEGKVKKHENTTEKKLKDRTMLTYTQVREKGHQLSNTLFYYILLYFYPA